MTCSFATLRGRPAAHALVVMALYLGALSGPATAFELSATGAAQLTPVEIKACKEGDGCTLITRMALLNAIEQSGEAAFALGVARGKAAGYQAGLNESRSQAPRSFQCS